MNLLPYVEDHRVRFNSDAVGADSTGAGASARQVPRIYANGEPKCATVFCTIGGMPDAGHRHDGFPIPGLSSIPYNPLDDDSFFPGVWPVFREVRRISAEVETQIKPFPAIGGQPGIEDGPALVNVFLEDPQDEPADRANFKVRPADGAGARVNGWAEVPGPGVDPGEIITVNLAGTIIQSPFINGDPAEHYEPGRIYTFCASPTACGDITMFRRDHQHIGLSLSKRRLIFLPSHGGFERKRHLSVDTELFREENGVPVRISGQISFSVRVSLDLRPEAFLESLDLQGRITPFITDDGSKFPTGYSISVSFPETTTKDNIDYLFKKWKVDGVNFGWEPIPDTFTVSPAAARAIKVRQCMSDCFVTAVYEEA